MTLRITPIQQRSATRIAEVLDACAAVIAEVGIEHVTTNLVAERAKCSIGTIYRYFPDRIAVLRALGIRQCVEVMRGATERLEAAEVTAEGFRGLLADLADGYFAWHRSRPGTSAIGYAHRLDMPVTGDESRIAEGCLRAGSSPRAQISGNIATRFLPEGELREVLCLDVDYITLLLVALADRAGALVREGADADAEYGWARKVLGCAIIAVSERFEELLAGRVPAAMRASD